MCTEQEISVAQQILQLRFPKFICVKTTRPIPMRFNIFHSSHILFPKMQFNSVLRLFLFFSLFSPFFLSLFHSLLIFVYLFLVRSSFVVFISSSVCMFSYLAFSLLRSFRPVSFAIYSYFHRFSITYFIFVRVEIFTAVTMKNAVFWDVEPCEPMFRRDVSPPSSG
jgi:hypothetical protein